MESCVGAIMLLMLAVVSFVGPFAFIFFMGPVIFGTSPAMSCAASCECQAFVRRNPGKKIYLLTPERAERVVAGAHEDLGSIFGYGRESLDEGSPGKVKFVEIEDSTVIVALAGEFRQPRADVLSRVQDYVRGRIPDAAGVRVSDEEMLVDRRDGQVCHEKRD
uniref:Uncharacterized protein n=1 Tax=Alexandrium andersonii TaxID=327968 RepID=A0A7S2FJ31_9DINO